MTPPPTIRYGARTSDQIENKEVKATSVGAWSTSLTAIFETDPDVLAAVLPPPLEPTDEPLVRVSVATVDLGGVKKEISLALLDGVQVGDYVILHVGYALTRLDPDEAERTLALFAQMNDFDVAGS